VTNEDAEYPSELDDNLILPNRRRLRIRALRPCEEEPIRELDAHLSPRTRYLRFFSPMPTLPDAVITLLACVDYRRRLALVAEYVGTSTEVVALGSFGAIDDRSVEVALVVRDDWQRQRVGTELARRVLQAAETRGFHRFIAHVMSDNVAIRRLLRHVGHVVSTTLSGSISEVAFVRRPPQHEQRIASEPSSLESASASGNSK
jgi:RimJ/RimL family protein N-acetyltransferase